MRDTNKKYFKPIPHDNRTKDVRVKLSQNDRLLLENLCIKHSLTMSEFIRQLIRRMGETE